MAAFHIKAISRTSLYSPNNTGSDAAIFKAVCDCLTERGHIISLQTEEEFQSSTETMKYALTMLRNDDSIKKMQDAEQKGCCSVNSAFGIQNCKREQLTKTLIEMGVPHPKSIIADTTENIIPLMENIQMQQCWLKRSDHHAIHKEDVSYARHREEAQELLTEYALRGIKRVVINEHLKGDLIKFYGVADTSFFHWFYPFDNAHSKFGLEKVNGKSMQIPFDLEKMQHFCRQAAEALHVKVYGGDCIVSEDGSIRIIDFNDWPSFSPCRKEAAVAIANCTEQTFKNHNK